MMINVPHHLWENLSAPHHLVRKICVQHQLYRKICVHPTIFARKICVHHTIFLRAICVHHTIIARKSVCTTPSLCKRSVCTPKICAYHTIIVRKSVCTLPSLWKKSVCTLDSTWIRHCSSTIRRKKKTCSLQNRSNIDCKDAPYNPQKSPVNVYKRGSLQKRNILGISINAPKPKVFCRDFVGNLGKSKGEEFLEKTLETWLW